MNFTEKQIRFTTLLASVLIHAGLFIQSTRETMSSQAQAPSFDTRISLNLRTPPKQVAQQLMQEIKPAEPRSKQKTQRKISKPQKVTRPVIQEKSAAPRVAKAIRRKLAKDSVVAKQKYLSYLLTHIEGYKFYPQSARRRGMEGDIQVSFHLLQNGNIDGLDARGGPLLLRRAAKHAVTQALPLPAPPVEMKYPIQVSYAMRFQLN